jgi:hypothetical protein
MPIITAWQAKDKQHWVQSSRWLDRKTMRRKNRNMKKLLVLSVLLGLMALPMFASDISFGGDATFGFTTDFDEYADTTDLTFDIMAAIDDYNSLTINMDGLEKSFSDIVDAVISDGDDPSPVGISKALVSTDLGMFFDLPVGVVLNWGYDDPGVNEFHSITGYDEEDVFNLDPDEYWGLDFVVSVKMLEFELAFNPDGSAGGYLLAGAAIKEPIPGLNAEFFYFQGGAGIAGDEFGDGQIALDAAYATTVGPVDLEAGVGFWYNLSDAAAAGSEYKIGVGVVAGMDLFEATVGIGGDDEDFLHTVGATVTVMPIDLLDIYAGVLMDLVDATNGGEDLQEIDLGINAHLGATEAYVGYLVTKVGAGDNFNAPPAPADGGFYVKFDVNY